MPSEDSHPFDLAREERIRKKVGHWKDRELDLVREVDRLEVESSRLLGIISDAYKEMPKGAPDSCGIVAAMAWCKAEIASKDADIGRMKKHNEYAQDRIQELETLLGKAKETLIESYIQIQYYEFLFKWDPHYWWRDFPDFGHISDASKTNYRKEAESKLKAEHPWLWIASAT
jgi:hypothetical protein